MIIYKSPIYSKIDKFLLFSLHIIILLLSLLTVSLEFYLYGLLFNIAFLLFGRLMVLQVVIYEDKITAKRLLGKEKVIFLQDIIKFDKGMRGNAYEFIYKKHVKIDNLKKIKLKELTFQVDNRLDLKKIVAFCEQKKIKVGDVVYRILNEF